MLFQVTDVKVCSCPVCSTFPPSLHDRIVTMTDTGGAVDQPVDISESPDLLVVDDNNNKRNKRGSRYSHLKDLMVAKAFV
jgi:hypothetical protein